MAIYELSTYGKQIITNEELIKYPLIRVFFSLFTLIFGFIIEYRVLRIFFQLWSQRKRSLIMTTLFIVYLMNNFFHTIHYSGIVLIINLIFFLLIFLAFFLTIFI